MRVLSLLSTAAANAARVALVLVWTTAAIDVGAFSAGAGALTGRTTKDGGSGCGSCHAQDGALSVSLWGPSSIPVRGTGGITLTASKSGAGSGVKLGMAAAASGGTLTEGSIYLVRVDPAGEIIHSAFGGSGGSLNTTNSSGIATYSFGFRMPDDVVVGSTYTIYALARLGGVHGWNHAVNLTITATANSPPAPTIGAVNAGNAQVTVNFTPPATNGGSAITGYAVTSFPDSITATGTASPITVTGLTNGTFYTFTAVATNAIGNSVASSASVTAMPGVAASAPLNVTATRGNASATIAFDAPATTGTGAISQYTVTANPGGATAIGSASPVAMTGLTNGTAYTFTVNATNLFGPGPDSAPSNVTTPQPIPGVASNLNAVGGNGQVTLTFDAAPDGGSPITSYIVGVSPMAGTDGSAGTAALTRTLSGLVNGTDYTFSVTAVNAFGSGSVSAPRLATPFTVPGVPTGVMAFAGNTSVTVSFTAPSGNGGASITGYTVVSNPPGGVDTNAGSASTTHILQNLINGTAYTFTVVATNAAGNGPSSASSNAIVPGGMNAPRVVWTRIMTRANETASACNSSATTLGPPIDADGNVFVIGCSLTASSLMDAVVHKLDGATGQTLWTATDAAASTIASLASDPAGNPILVSKTNNPMFSYVRTKVSKLSGASGQLIWSTEYPSQTSGENVMDLAADGAGNIAINAQNSFGIHTVKLDGNTGNQLWTRDSSRYARGLALDRAGNVVVTGNTEQNFRDVRVVKYDGANGNTHWDSTFDGMPAGTYDAGLALATDLADDVFAATDSSGGGAILKFERLSGALIWSAIDVTTRWTALAVDGAGHVIATGASNDAVGGYNFRTIKYDGATGAVMWSVSYNGSANGGDGGTAIALDGNGNAVVVGTSIETNGGRNIRALKYRGIDGSLMWSHEYVSLYFDQGFQVAIAPDNAAIITGRLPSDRSTQASLLVQKLADVVPPSAPLNVTATALAGAIRLDFLPPSDDGGAAVISYTATCGSENTIGNASAMASPITFTGIMPNVSYVCSVVASNSAGSGAPSATVSATPLASIALTGVVSRKTHAAAGAFDVVMDAAVVNVEPRAIGLGHTILFQFNNTITAAGNVSVIDSASAVVAASATASGNSVIVTIPVLADNKRVTISLTGVNGTVNVPPIPMGFLVGDANNTRSVNASDISAVKARSGQPTTSLNFRSDLNASGGVNAADISAAKARSGLALP